MLNNKRFFSIGENLLTKPPSRDKIRKNKQESLMVDQKEFTSILTGTFQKNGLSSFLSQGKVEMFYRLTEYMLEQNKLFNLTAITEPDKIVLLHYADCAKLAAALPKNIKMIDIGCGAGFPTLPVAILRPDVEILAIDSTAKKVNYVASAAAMLGLTNVKTEVARAEDLAKGPSREHFDVATARAVSELRILAELALPFVRLGGQFIAMKGKNAEFELTSAKRALAMLGGKVKKTEKVTLTDGKETMEHPLIFIDKATKTPDAYPRAYAQITKKPL